MFDVFISLESSLLASRALTPPWRSPACYCEIHSPDKLNFSYLLDWHRLTLVLYQSHLPSRQTCGKGIGLPSFDVQSFSRRTGAGLIGINPGGNDVLACR